MTNKLKVLRAEHSLSQEDLARIIGVSRQTINALEKGKYVASTVLSLKIARHFNVALEHIFQLDEND